MVTKEEVVKAWNESGNYVSGFLDKHPEDVKWYKHEIFKSDIINIYHSWSSNWGPITKSTFRVEETVNMLNTEENEIRESDREEFILHKTKIHFLLNNGFDDPIKGLILITKDLNGPYTIIDGNHRFTAHYIKNADNLENYLICGNAFVGISQNFDKVENYFYAC